MELSIITVNLNNAAGLQRTIESVACQQYRDFGYVIVDGGSTDGSTGVIESLHEHLPRLHWVSEPDGGIYEAMNKGIRMAEGKYLLFLNSGDFLVGPEVLGQVFVTERNADILTGRCRVSEKGKVIHITTPPDLLTFGYLYRNGLAHQSTFIRRALFERLGPYREDFRYNADIEFWYRAIVLNGATTENIETEVADYNTDGISSKECTGEAYLQEMYRILSHPALRLFLHDYDAMDQERKEMAHLWWAAGKPWIDGPLRMLYRAAVRYNKLKR